MGLQNPETESKLILQYKKNYVTLDTKHEGRSRLMFDGINYVVQFDDGNYYTGNGLRFYADRLSSDIANAQLYKFEWQISKDLYLQQYLHGKTSTYKIIKVQVTTLVEIIND